MAGEAGGDPRAWLAVDETAAAFLSRSLSTRPPILLPLPLRPGNVVEIAGPSNSGKSQVLLMVQHIQQMKNMKRMAPKINFVVLSSTHCFLIA